MPIKYVITGGAGFVGNYLFKHLMLNYPDSRFYSLGHSEPKTRILSVEYLIVDLLDEARLETVLDQIKPDYIFHLAALSSVGQSWDEPAKSFSNNLNIYLNLLEVVRKIKLDCKILSIGSSESYGLVQKFDHSLSENDKLNPISPYAVARVSQEMMTNVYVKGFGLQIISTRSFNHIGPGQDSRFAIPSFVNKAIQAKEIDQIEVGDLSIVRDFTDVRDVVSAYDLLIHQGRVGEIYNVCSGKGHTLQTITDLIKEALRKSIVFVQNKSFFRPMDNPIIIGNNNKIFSELGWEQKIPLTQSIKEMIHFALKS